jgi:hypothetical protein
MGMNTNFTEPPTTTHGDEHVVLHRKELAGSRLRCLMATSLPRQQACQFLSELVRPFAEVSRDDVWMPRGFLDPDEAMLGVAERFLNPETRESLLAWWLAVARRPVTPNWDLVSTCRVGADLGLILVEAKAHAGELKPDDRCGATSQKNCEKIAAAIAEANAGLTEVAQGWNLSHKSHYQLSNRFAWAWKLATIGVPVVLVYLGFLNAAEMARSHDPMFTSADHWRQCVLDYSRGVVPESAWQGQRIPTKGSFFIPLIRSADFQIDVTGESQIRT